MGEGGRATAPRRTPPASSPACPAPLLTQTPFLALGDPRRGMVSPQDPSLITETPFPSQAPSGRAFLGDTNRTLQSLLPLEPAEPHTPTPVLPPSAGPPHPGRKPQALTAHLLPTLGPSAAPGGGSVSAPGPSAPGSSSWLPPQAPPPAPTSTLEQLPLLSLFASSARPQAAPGPAKGRGCSGRASGDVAARKDGRTWDFSAALFPKWKVPPEMGHPVQWP